MPRLEFQPGTFYFLLKDRKQLCTMPHTTRLLGHPHPEDTELLSKGRSLFFLVPTKPCAMIYKVRTRMSHTKIKFLERKKVELTLKCISSRQQDIP